MSGGRAAQPAIAARMPAVDHAYMVPGRHQLPVGGSVLFVRFIKTLGVVLEIYAA